MFHLNINVKSKVKKFCHTAKDFFFDYSEHSTIHGISYVGERHRSWIEKIWWIVALCFSLICCGYLILDAWSNNPIIINFKPTPIWEVSDVM
jgi:acid-sensing ion channel, other